MTEKCWNSKIENDINSFLLATYPGQWIEGEYNKGEFMIVLKKTRYVFPYVCYTCDNSSMFTKAGNYRINAMDVQQKIEDYRKSLNVQAGLYEKDKSNLDDIIDSYTAAMEKAKKIVQSVQPETKDIIRRNGIFYSSTFNLFL